MKHGLKKFCAVLLALALVPVATACNRGGGEITDTNKTQLYVGVFEGGLGSDWTYALKKEFEAKYADVSFEAGKTGVQVKIAESRAFSETFGEEGTVNMTQDVIFAEGASTLFCAERGDFLDITDVVTKPLGWDFVRGKMSSDDTETIEGKLDDRQKAYYSAVGEKYYALPTAEAFIGISYDIELFEDNNLYFAPNGEFVQSKTAPRGSGPDGDLETAHDNGLPQTFEQFYRLCDKVKGLNMTPVMWGGALQEYVSFLLLSLEADIGGAEQMYLNYDYNGTTRPPVAMTKPIQSFGAGNVPVFGGDVAITAANGYELYKQPAKYYALKFLEGIVKNGYYNTSNGTSSAFTHQDAEGAFISAKYNTKIKRAAMLVDGNWWESEARGTFADWEAEKGPEASMQNRKFGMMPLPKINGQSLGDFTILTYQGHIGVVNSHTPDYKVNLAKAFLQYCYTEPALRTYTLHTNICRPVSYDMGEDYGRLSPIGKANYDLHVGAKKVSMESSAKINRNYNVDIWYAPNLWKSTVKGGSHIYPSLAMINHGVSAEDYFMGLQTYWTQGVWKSTFQNV